MSQPNVDPTRYAIKRSADGTWTVVDRLRGITRKHATWDAAVAHVAARVAIRPTRRVA